MKGYKTFCLAVLLIVALLTTASTGTLSFDSFHRASVHNASFNRIYFYNADSIFADIITADGNDPDIFADPPEFPQLIDFTADVIPPPDSEPVDWFADVIPPPDDDGNSYGSADVIPPPSEDSIFYNVGFSYPIVSDSLVYINSTLLSTASDTFLQNDVMYVPLRDFMAQCDSSTEITWNPKSVKIVTSKLTITLNLECNYISANGRYFYLPDPAITRNGVMYVPLRALAKVLCANIYWDNHYKTADFVLTGDTLKSGDKYYNSTDLYWLSHIIYAESGIEPLSGQIAVGNVVMNRVADDYFPNSVKAVILQHNGSVYQFSPAKSGSVYNEPSELSVIAAKLVLEGANTAGDSLYFMNAKLATTKWISNNRTVYKTIGHHTFYL